MIRLHKRLFLRLFYLFFKFFLRSANVSVLCDSGAATSLKQTSHYDELYCVFCLQQTGFFLVEYFTHTQERETRVDSKDENKSDKINKVKWRRDASRVRLTSSLSEKWAAVNFLLFLIVFAKKTVFSAVKQRLVLVFIKKKKRERERKKRKHSSWNGRTQTWHRKGLKV